MCIDGQMIGCFVLKICLANETVNMFVVGKVFKLDDGGLVVLKFYAPRIYQRGFRFFFFLFSSA